MARVTAGGGSRGDGISAGSGGGGLQPWRMRQPLRLPGPGKMEGCACRSQETQKHMGGSFSAAAAPLTRPMISICMLVRGGWSSVALAARSTILGGRAMPVALRADTNELILTDRWLTVALAAAAAAAEPFLSAGRSAGGITASSSPSAASGTDEHCPIASCPYLDFWCLFVWSCISTNAPAN